MAERKLEFRIGATITELDKATQKAAKAIGRFGKELQNVGSSLTNVVTVPLVGLGAAAVAASESIDDAMDRIRVGTGATGETLDALGGSFKAVFSTVPDSAEAVSTAIASIHQRTGATGVALEGMATQMLNLSRLSGTEVGPLVDSTTKAFASWGVATKDQGAALDGLFKVSQNTGVGVEALAQQLTSGGASLRALGVPMQSAAAMLGTFAKAGVDSGTAMTGLTKAATTFAKSGEDMGSGLTRVMESIKSAPTETAAAALAFDTFGKSGVTMADAIRRGALDVQGLTAALAASPESINRAAADTAGLSEAMGILKNKLTAALEPLGTAIVQAFLKLMPLVTTAVGHLQSLVGVFSSLPTGVQTSIVVLGAIAAAVGPVLIALGAVISSVASVVTSGIALKAAIGPVLVAVGGWFATASTAIGGAWTSVTAAFAGTAAAAGPVIATVATVGRALLALATGPVGIAVAALTLLVVKWDWVKEKSVAAASAIGSALSGAWDKIKSGASAVWGEISKTVSTMGRQAMDAASSMVSRVTSSARTMSDAFWDIVHAKFTQVQDFAKGIWDKLIGGVQTAANAVKSTLQGLLDTAGSIANAIISKATQAINAVKSMVGGGGGGGGGGGMTIPAFAGGGFVNKPTLALVGEKGPEYIVPAADIARFSGGGSGGVMQALFHQMSLGVMSPASDVITPHTLAGPGGPSSGVTIIWTGDVVAQGDVATQQDIAERVRKDIIRTGQRNGSTGVNF